MSEQFKAGDEVYCPRLNGGIHALIESKDHRYPLYIERFTSMTDTGLQEVSNFVPQIFHATPENKLLLEALYKCEFESPKLKGSDLTRKLLSEGAKFILCRVHTRSDNVAGQSNDFAVIKEVLETNSFFKATDGCVWEYAVPCNDYANLVDGVLEVKK